MTSTILRAAAMTMVVVAIIDPSVASTRRAPVAVDLRLSERALPSDELRAAAADVRQRLERALGDDVAFDSAEHPSARVLIGEGAAIVRDDENVPISTVRLIAESAPNLRIISASNPGPVPIGWSAQINVTIEARGLNGSASAIVLEQDGTEIARMERKWSRDRERADVNLPYSPSREGASRVTLRVEPMPAEASRSDNAVDIEVVGTARRLRVFVHEPRPSWAAAFVRRALEANPSFDVSALTIASRQISIRAGEPPTSLSSGTLNSYDAVIVGAPDSLTAADVNALETFARVRGGTVVLLPDRRPAGRYLELVGNVDFEEVLVDVPLDVQTTRGVKIRASELAVRRGDLLDDEILASVELQRVRRALVFSRVLGDGAVIMSGALDAWRYRGQADDGFARFWQSVIAQAALSSRARLAVEIEPAIAAPGANVIVRARVRRTEIQELGDRSVVPAVRARVIGPAGSQERIRLWPTAERGLFEGRFKAPPPGSYDVRIDGAGTSADAVLVSATDARPSPTVTVGSSDSGSALLAAASAGVVVDADDLGPLARHLRSLPRSETPIVRHPARSSWFVAVFAGLLCAEWLLRRKRGLA
jgi:hypothetical protein